MRCEGPSFRLRVLQAYQQYPPSKKKILGTIHPSESGITGSGLRSVTESTQPISRMNSIVSFGPPLCRFLFSFSSLNNS